MKTFEINYRTFNHINWLCTEHIQAKDQDDALKKAEKKIKSLAGNGFKIVMVKEEK